MKNRHEGALVWIIPAVVAVAGLALYLFIPQYKIASGAAVGLILLLVLKHVGLLATFGAPITALLRKYVMPYFHGRAGQDQ